MRRTLSIALLAVGAAVLSATAGASGGARVDVVEIGGPIDGRLVDFAVGAIEGSDASLVVLEIDSTATLTTEIDRLVALVEDAPVPVAVWVGPAPGVAHGGAAQVLAAAPIRGAAPGSFVGYLAPTVAGGAEDSAAVADRYPEVPVELMDGRVEVSGPVPGLVDVVSPSIGQFVTGLDGTTVSAGSTEVVLDTAVTVEEDGIEVIRPAGEVRFSEPGLLTRALRVTIRPEAALLFLVMGVAMIALEIYAAGPGLAAAVGGLSLFMAAYGLAVLPTNWWAAAMALGGLVLYLVDFQRNGLGVFSLAGTGLLVAGGLLLIDGGPQLQVVWWPVALVALGALLFFGFALTTVSRSRFSTDTIGREHLVGAAGTAVGGLDPDGVVEVDGARWRAVAPRAAGIGPGDPVTVVGVDGIVLEVDEA